MSRDEFTRLVQPLVPTLFRLCLALSDTREGAEDLLQTALVRAYTRRSSFRAEGPLTAWLCAIVRNEHSEVIRQTARRRSLLRAALDRFGEVFEDWSAQPDASPEQHSAIAEDSSSVLAAMQELPESYRTVLWMCDVDDLSYQATSEALGIPIGTVKSRHARGRAKLRSILEQRNKEVES